MQTIEDVLVELDRIIDIERQRCSFRGYFAAMYRATTERVRQGVVSGAFTDGPRMVRMDVRFASFYIDAWKQHEARQATGQGPRPSKPWRLAFGSARLEDPLIVQHMLLGMNAHINLDLPQAAVAIAGDDLPSFKADFMQINLILQGLLGEVQEVIDDHSPYMRRLDWWGGNKDEAFFSWSVNRARDAAWANTRLLHHVPGPLEGLVLAELELSAAAFARLIRATPVPESIRVSESDWRRPSKVAAIIDELRQIT
jgi:hypothetical protein